MNNKLIVRHLPLTKARAMLDDLAHRAHVNKEYFIIEKNGVPFAGILNEDELEDYLELRDRAVCAQIAKSNADVADRRTRAAAGALTLRKRVKG